MFPLNQKCLRCCCFKKIGGTGQTDGQTYRQTYRQTNGQGATLNVVSYGGPHNNNSVILYTYGIGLHIDRVKSGPKRIIFQTIICDRIRILLWRVMTVLLAVVEMSERFNSLLDTLGRVNTGDKIDRIQSRFCRQCVSFRCQSHKFMNIN